MRGMRAKSAESALALLSACVSAVAVFAAADSRAVDSSSMPFTRYQDILDILPFGPPPPGEYETPETGDGPEDGETGDIPEIEVIPDGLDKVKITLLSRFNGIPAVGFIDGGENKSYYLLEGQSFGKFTCEEVYFDKETVLISFDGRSAELPLWINPATTNRADVTTFGQPGGQPVVLQTKTDWEIEQDREAERLAKEEMAERRRKRREEWENRRRQAAEELAKMTPEQRERRMRDINLDIIISGKGPPLPVELDEEDVERLKEAGFEIPSEEERANSGGRGRRGGRGGFGGPGFGGPGFGPPGGFGGAR